MNYLTLGLAVSSRIWDKFQGRMCAVRNLSLEMLHVYILHSLTFNSLVVSISTSRFNTKTFKLRVVACLHAKTPQGHFVAPLFHLVGSLLYLPL